MIEVIGIIAITLLLGWVAMVCFAFAVMCIGGFDEVNIPVGLLFIGFLVGDICLWWFLVGHRIHLSFS